MIISVKKQAWVHVALYAALIFFLSSLERPFPPLDRFKKYHIDWLLHIVEYGVLGALLARALRLSFGRAMAWRLGAAAFFIGCLYGVSDEWHQSFVPHRDASVFDWTADSIGTLLGASVWINGKNLMSGVGKREGDDG